MLTAYPCLSGVEHLENELASELENARLFRLLCKFGFINERPECVVLTYPPLPPCHLPGFSDEPVGLLVIPDGARLVTGILSSSSEITFSTR